MWEKNPVYETWDLGFCQPRAKSDALLLFSGGLSPTASLREPYPKSDAMLTPASFDVHCLSRWLLRNYHPPLQAASVGDYCAIAILPYRLPQSVIAVQLLYISSETKSGTIFIHSLDRWYSIVKFSPVFVLRYSLRRMWKYTFLFLNETPCIICSSRKPINSIPVPLVRKFIRSSNQKSIRVLLSEYLTILKL